MQPTLTLSAILLALLSLQGCSNNSSIFSRDNIPFVHRIDIQQGNVIDQNMLAQLEPGMDKKKVFYIMGTPIIKDTFHNDRWDYIYTYKKAREPREQRHVTLFFRDNRLARVTGDIEAANGPIEMTSRNMEKVDVPEADPDTVLSKLKKALSSDDEPLIKDEPNVPEAAKETIEDELKTTEEKTSDVVKQTIAEPSEIEDNPEPESTEDEDRSGFFDKAWGQEKEPAANDPVLNDPVLNPDF